MQNTLTKMTIIRFGGHATRVLPLMALLAGALLLGACDGGGGAAAGGDAAGSTSSTANTSILPAGDADCPQGGIQVDSGIDDNGNGVLDPAEVDHSEKVCNGGTSLVATADEPPGANCTYGGVVITGGLDGNGNGVLDAGEVDASLTRRVCNTGPTYAYQMAQLYSSELQMGDRFGNSVSISGDRMIVGAYWEDWGPGDPHHNAGAAYVFERDAAGAWNEVAILFDSSPQADALFGRSVSISGDYAIVGAPLEDFSGPSQAGAAYVYERNAAGQWIQKQTLYASNLEASALFGSSVSISGGYAIVGAPLEDFMGLFADVGAAYVYERTGGGLWLEAEALHASDADSVDQFGYSVAISGGHAIVGANLEDGGAAVLGDSAGAAYVYERTGGGRWFEEAILHASDAQAGDRFGYSVAISGDYAIVGALSEDGGVGDPADNSGAAYVFERTGGVWLQPAILRASDAQAFDNFGFSVSISGGTAVVGAIFENGGAGDPLLGAGAAYVFRGNGGAWEQTRSLRASDAQMFDEFGGSVAISGGTAVVSASAERGGAGDPVHQAGTVYMFQ